MIDLKLKHCVNAAFLSLLMAVPLHAAALKSAEITAIVNDVKVVNAGQGARPAQLQETISGQSSVQTGIKSRTELLFSDKTMARLGANSMFSFTNGTRDINLQEGTMMLQVPKGAGGAKITTAAVTAAITGTTIMIEYFPGGFTKVIVLEGTLRLFLNNRVGESILLAPGKMIILNPNATQLPEPVDVDIKRLVKTSKLIQGINGTDLDLKLVDKEISNQDKEKKKGDLIGTNLVITGSGTEVILASEQLLNTLQNASSNQQELLGVNNGSGGSPVSSKYQPVSTITTPNPYIINNTTTIVTDPTITTNGVTNQGTLYNSSVQSGNTSAFLFGSTSSFDTASGFDTSFLNEDYSVFRFSELQFAGTPTFNTAGGPKKLFLVSESNISTLPGSFPLNFSGLDFVGLATVDGYISLGNSITSITGPGLTLDFQARGANGEIFVDAPINLSGGTVDLYAESNVNLGGSITASSVTARAFGNITNVSGSSQINAASVDLNASGTVTLYTGSINPTGLTSLSVTGGSIVLNGTQDYSGSSAKFNAGTGGITGNTGTSLLNVGTINTTGSISFTSGNLSAGGLIAASGGINVSGTLTAGGVGAASNISAGTITSTGVINSTAGSITTTSGNLDATTNITANTTINSAGSISAGATLSGTSITASGGISGGTITTTSGNIDATGGNLLSAGAITSAGSINAAGGISSGGNITAVIDVTSGSAPSATPDIAASGTISGVNIHNNGTGNIVAGGNITATGALGTLAAGSGTTVSSPTGQITAGSIDGPSSGQSTFSAGTIVVGNVASNSVLLNAQTVTVNAQTSNLDAGVFTSTAKYITIDGSSAVTLSFTNPFASLSSPITSLTTNSQVTISGSNNLFVDTAVLGNDITLTGGSLYTDNMTVTGNMSVDQIARTTAGLGGALQIISASGTVTASTTDGLDFQGTTGLGGGKLNLSASSVNFGTGGINGANFVGGDSTSTAVGGTGGNLNVTSTSGSITQDAGDTISDHGGANTGGGNGGTGGNVTLTSAKTQSLQGSIKVDGGGGSINGGNAGQILATANNASGAITLGGSSSLSAAGGNGNSGNGGNGGIINLQATGSGGTISSTPYGSVFANGGNGLAGFGGNGGTILWTATGAGGTINHGSYGTFSANGGSSSAGAGGSGGTITLSAENITTISSTTISASGGSTSFATAEGGNGGTINLTSSNGGTINMNGNHNATTGINNGVTYGGSGGTVNVTGGGTINVGGIVKTSEDAGGTADSKNGGTISLTSTDTNSANQGITIGSTGQLLALLNAASPGKGGKIEFISAGSQINVAGKVDAGHKGSTGASGTNGLLQIVNNGASGAINILNTATLRGDVVKAAAFGTNGVLTINGGGAGGLTADSQAKLYANSNTGTVLFTGGTVNITSPDIRISANTVQVANGTTVNTGAVSAIVYANNRVWNGSQGGTGGTTGSWSTTPTNGGTPSSAPTF